MEQVLINESVKVDFESGTTTAKLPFIFDPIIKIAPNKEKALSIYRSQLKRLNKNPQDKADLIKSEAFSPTIILAALVFPDGIVGNMEASATRNPSTP